MNPADLGLRSEVADRLLGIVTTMAQLESPKRLWAPLMNVGTEGYWGNVRCRGTQHACGRVAVAPLNPVFASLPDPHQLESALLAVSSPHRTSGSHDE